MLDILLGVVGTVFGWVGALFPASPFANYVQVTQDMQLGLVWHIRIEIPLHLI